MNITSNLLGSFFNTSRSSDSVSLLEQTPEFESQIAPLTNHIPRLGDSLQGFFGFFERDFRSFDFYLGVWEAREYFRKSLRLSGKLVLPELSASSVDARKLACMDLKFQPGSEVRACEATGDPNFEILVDLAVARLQAKRTDLSYVLKYLAEHNYEYRDLGLSGSEARQAPAKIKRAAMNSISNLASSQSFSEGFVLSAAGPLVINLMEPLPTYRDLAITFGSQTQITISTLLDSLKSTRPRWTFGVGLENTSAWLGSDGGKVIATPLIGLEIEPVGLNSSLLQTRLSLSAGYKFGEASRGSACRENSRFTQDCTGVSTRLGVSLTIIERLRFQTELEVMPFQKPWDFSFTSKRKSTISRSRRCGLGL
ncbi:MAG: hypothetical protein EOP05_16745 [Proteobacteria bacterium]|nr:MAG: hypothetical protein EOP05_16745 [Pseudomonadota bacterium]